MKPFRFRLESLLTLRLREEDKRRDALAYAEERRHKAERAVAAGEAALEELENALTHQRQGRLNCRDHLLMLHAMDLQRAECRRLVHVLGQSTAEVQSKLEDMVVAKREREIVTRLKEKQQTEHLAEMARKEELEISDMIGARHALQQRAQHETHAAA